MHAHPGGPDELDALVSRLELEPHPEGGWYRRTWTSPVRIDGGERAAASSILYLLGEHEVSRWHRIDAVESWHHAAGAPLQLSCSDEHGPVRVLTLGADVLAGQQAQVVVDAMAWQSATPVGGWSLVSCVVVPEFRFEGFELAPEGWAPPGGRPVR